MDDENFDFGDDFDLEADNIFGDEDDTLQNDGQLAHFDTEGVAVSQVYDAEADMLGGGSNTARANAGDVNARYEAEQGGVLVPAVIENVQVYLPHVAPNAYPVIVAVLAQAHIGMGVDLCELSCATRNVEFTPNKRVSCAIMRIQDPSAVIVVRTSGALGILGAASISEARQAAETAVRIIRRALSLPVTSFQFRVRSLMARFNACSPVRLDDLSRHQLQSTDPQGIGGFYSSYEPERFCGCNIRLVGKYKENMWSVNASVFVTGKITFLGARSDEELRFAFDGLIPIISRYTSSYNGETGAPSDELG